ncbi:F510_1955 family glycosylhydrolase [Paenibacillus abyssi]|uniref:Glycosyl hydrolase n=1 Tax=Paenibacillus abyssi TaxID=1340531 RepID=A0A917LHL3_9BACL|nr:glycosyl hydrolase [Paenibacillus abyssi]GGG24365.1 hypothetical protein GCM10010916_46100 [Paenibacillus abyssi]
MILTLLLSVSIITAACSSNSAKEHAGHTSNSSVFMHVHGLGYSGDGERLFVPVHHGLSVYEGGAWNEVPGEKHDYMGFAPIDKGFYSSGHPAPGSDYKDPLGIVKSTDEGVSLEILSLEGEVDFHGLAASFRDHTIYVLNPGPNSIMEEGGLYYSLDETKTWTRSNMEGVTDPITAFAVHPTDGSIIALGTTTGAYLSNDYGQSFTKVSMDESVTALAISDDGDLLIGTEEADAPLVELYVESGQIIEIDIPLDSEDAIYYMAINPVNPSEITVATANKNIYLTPDNGTTWKQIADNGEMINE